MTDWPSIVSDLLSSGLTRPELARRVGAGISTLNDLRWGKATDPRFALGQRLLDLHAERVQLNDKNAKTREIKRAQEDRKRG